MNSNRLLIEPSIESVDSEMDLDLELRCFSFQRFLVHGCASCMVVVAVLVVVHFVNRNLVNLTLGNV